MFEQINQEQLAAIGSLVLTNIYQQHSEQLISKTPDADEALEKIDPKELEEILSDAELTASMDKEIAGAAEGIQKWILEGFKSIEKSHFHHRTFPPPITWPPSGDFPPVDRCEGLFARYQNALGVILTESLVAHSMRDLLNNNLATEELREQWKQTLERAERNARNARRDSRNLRRALQTYYCDFPEGEFFKIG